MRNARCARPARASLAPSKFIWKSGKFAQYRRSLPLQSLRARVCAGAHQSGIPLPVAITQLPFTRVAATKFSVYYVVT